jgi:hypothetical protein
LCQKLKSCSNLRFLIFHRSVTWDAYGDVKLASKIRYGGQ